MFQMLNQFTMVYSLVALRMPRQTHLSQNHSAENRVLIFNFNFQIHEGQLVCTDLKSIICPQTTRESAIQNKTVCLETVIAEPRTVKDAM